MTIIPAFNVNRLLTDRHASRQVVRHL